MFVQGETQASGSGEASGSRKTEASQEPQEIGDTVVGDSFDPAKSKTLDEEFNANEEKDPDDPTSQVEPSGTEAPDKAWVPPSNAAYQKELRDYTDAPKVFHTPSERQAPERHDLAPGETRSKES